MVKFAFKEFETEYPNWSKHHKVLGLHVMSTYENGEVVKTKDEELNVLVEANPDALIKKGVHVFRNNAMEPAIQYYLPLENQDYIEADVPYYSQGASNTKQQTKLRLTFRIEYDLVILEDAFESKGRLHSNLIDILGDLEHLFEEMAEKDDIKEHGIAYTEDEEGDYDVVIVRDHTYSPDVLPLSKDELMNSLISAEIYHFNMDIVEPEKESEAEWS